MTDCLTLVVLLQVNSAHKADYERFESAASRIMSRYGGRIERRVAVTRDPSAIGGDPDLPDEIHVVTFPDEEGFDAYVQDPELGALAELRTRAVRRTVVWRGTDLPTFTDE